MPRIAFIAFSVGAFLAAGCGKAAPTVDANPSISRAQALAFANAVNLRPTDVPHLVASRPDERLTAAGPPALPRQVEACDGGSILSPGTPGIVSPLYHSKSKASSGRVEVIPPLHESKRKPSRIGQAQYAAVASVVYPTAGDPSAASRLVADVSSAHGRACITRFLASEKSQSAGSGEQPVTAPAFTHIKVTTLPSPLPGDPIFGVRATVTEAGLAIFGSRPQYQSRDLFAFFAGPMLVTLKINGEPRPFPAQEEKRLLSLLYNRAEAHKLA